MPGEEVTPFAANLGRSTNVPAVPRGPNWRYARPAPPRALPAPQPIDVDSRVLRPNEPGNPNWRYARPDAKMIPGSPRGQLPGPVGQMPASAAPMSPASPASAGPAGPMPKPAAAMPPPMSGPSPWEAHFRDTLRPDGEEAFRNTLRGGAGYQGGVSPEPKQPGLLGRAMGYFRGTPEAPSAGPAAATAESQAAAQGGRLGRVLNAGRGAMGLGGKALGLAGKAMGGLPNLAATGVNLGEYLTMGDATNKAGWHDGSRLMSQKVHANAGDFAGGWYDMVPGNMHHAFETVGEGAKHLGGALFGQHGLGLPDHSTPYTANPSGRQGSVGPQTYEGLRQQWAADYSPAEIARRDALTPGRPQGDIPALMAQASALLAAPHDANSPMDGQLRRALQQGGGQGPGVPAQGGVTADPQAQLSDTLARNAMDAANNFGLPRGTWLPPEAGQQMMAQQQGALGTYLDHQGILDRRHAAEGANRAHMLAAQAQMVQANAEMKKMELASDPALAEAQLGMPPGELAGRRMLQGAPGLAPFHNKPDLTADTLREAMSGHENDRGHRLAMAQIFRQQMTQNPEWLNDQTTPGGGENFWHWLTGAQFNPRYEANRRFLAPYQSHR